MRKKVLITGSNGLLGQKLLEAFRKEKNFEIIASSKGKDRTPQEHINHNYVSLDITQEEEIVACFDKHQPDVLINCAAMTNVDACEDNREACYKLNVAAVDYMADACLKYDTHFVHLSTDFIFDGTAGPYKEDSPAKPTCYYGESKLLSEEILQQKLKRYSILRTVLVYGIIHDLHRSNIVLWAKKALEAKQEMKIVNDQFRTPTLVEDLANACLLATKKEAFGLYHISGKDFLSILELVKKIADFWGLETDTVIEISSDSLDLRADRPLVTGLDISKAIEELGYQPHSIGEGLALVDQQLKTLNKKH